MFPKPELERVLGKTLGSRCSKSRRCGSRSSAPGSRRGKPTSFGGPWRRSSSRAGSRTFRDKLVEGMVANGYEREFAERTFRPARGLWVLRLPGEPRSKLRAHRVRFELVEVLAPGRVLRGAAERPAEGLLRPGADRARRAGARGRGATGLHQCQSMGLRALEARESGAFSDADDGRYAVRLGLRMVRGWGMPMRPASSPQGRTSPSPRSTTFGGGHGFRTPPSTSLPKPTPFVRPSACRVGMPSGQSKPWRRAAPAVRRSRRTGGGGRFRADRAGRAAEGHAGGRRSRRGLRHVGLTLRQHPVSFLRAELVRRRHITCAEACRLAIADGSRSRGWSSSDSDRVRQGRHVHHHRRRDGRCEPRRLDEGVRGEPSDGPRRWYEGRSRTDPKRREVVHLVAHSLTDLSREFASVGLEEDGRREHRSCNPIWQDDASNATREGHVGSLGARRGRDPSEDSGFPLSEHELVGFGDRCSNVSRPCAQCCLQLLKVTRPLPGARFRCSTIPFIASSGARGLPDGLGPPLPRGLPRSGCSPNSSSGGFPWSRWSSCWAVWLHSSRAAGHGSQAMLLVG